MRIKYIQSKDKRVFEFNKLVKQRFPSMLKEKNPELFLIAGGDGAMLHAIHDTIHTGIPYLGKALGTFNFLMNKIENNEEILQAILDNKLKIHTFKTHTIEAILDGKKIGEAVNDVIIGNNLSDYFTMNISTQTGDFANFEIKGSGLCISTTIGSTAFNFNNGGRILPLDSDLLSITGVVCNRYLNDIIPFTEIYIKGNGAKIYLSNIECGVLKEGSTLVLKKGSRVDIGFLDKDCFLKRRITLSHRFRSTL